MADPDNTSSRLSCHVDLGALVLQSLSKTAQVTLAQELHELRGRPGRHLGVLVLRFSCVELAWFALLELLQELPSEGDAEGGPSKDSTRIPQGFCGVPQGIPQGIPRGFRGDSAGDSVGIPWDSLGIPHDFGRERGVAA